MEHSSGAVRTECDIKIDGNQGAGRPKLQLKKLMEKDCRDWKLRGQKVKYHLISITKSISKIFITNFVCVLTNKRHKTYQRGYSFCGLGQAPGVGLWGAWVDQGVKKIFFKHGHVAYQINGDDEQNRMQVKFSS